MRQPNPWLLGNKNKVLAVLLAVGLIGAGLFFFMKSLGAIIGGLALGSAVIAWAVINHKISPEIADYVEFLEIEIEETYPGFVEATQESFKNIWQIEDMLEVIE